MSERCRLTNARSLARFAALYADHVVIRHPFTSYIPATTRLVDDDGTETILPAPAPGEWSVLAREHLIVDLKIALYFRALAEDGIASFTSARSAYCAVCTYNTHKMAPDVPAFPRISLAWQGRLSEIVAYIYEAFENRTTAILDRGPNGHEVLIAGDPALVEHGERRFCPRGLEEMFRDELDRLPVALSFQQLLKTRILHDEIERLVNDI